MRTIEQYKIFLRDKSIDELQYNFSLWISELEFIGVELSFIKHLLTSYPVQSKIPNLFEHIQLFIKDINKTEKERSTINMYILEQLSQLSGLLEFNDLSCDSIYIIEYEKLAKHIFKYLKNYRDLKIHIYEFMNGILE